MKKPINIKKYFILMLYLLISGCKKSLEFKADVLKIRSKNVKKAEALSFKNSAGLGDKLLDLIGLMTLADYVDTPLELIWKPRDYNGLQNQVYDLSYFRFPQQVIPEYSLKSLDESFLVNYYTGISLNPHSLSLLIREYHQLKNSNDLDLTQKIGHTFLMYAQQISFADSILDRIPENISQAIGLHLRKSDKIKTDGSTSHQNSVTEFENYIDALKKYLQMLTEKGEKLFFVTSEDPVWKKEFEDLLELWDAKIIRPKYFNSTQNNENDILDFAALTKTKKIVQGLKYSTFSIAASLIGNIPLVNMLNLEDHTDCFLHAWRPYLFLISQGRTGWVIENQPFRDLKWLLQNPLPLNFKKFDITYRFVNSFFYHSKKIHSIF